MLRLGDSQYDLGLSATLRISQQMWLMFYFSKFESCRRIHKTAKSDY